MAQYTSEKTKNLRKTIYDNMDGPRSYHAKWDKPDREG